MIDPENKQKQEYRNLNFTSTFHFVELSVELLLYQIKVLLDGFCAIKLKSKSIWNEKNTASYSSHTWNNKRIFVPFGSAFI